MIGVLLGTQSAPLDPELRAVIELALVRSGYSHKAAALELGKDESQFSRELGSGAMRLRDLFALQAKFWVELLPILASRYGMQCTSEDAAVRALSDMADLMGRLARQLRPARMTLTAATARKDRAS